jgi:hypothetical protein
MTRASGHHSHDGHPERGYAEDDDQTTRKPSVEEPIARARLLRSITGRHLALS